MGVRRWNVATCPVLYGNPVGVQRAFITSSNSPSTMLGAGQICTRLRRLCKAPEPTRGNRVLEQKLVSWTFQVQPLGRGAEGLVIHPSQRCAWGELGACLCPCSLEAGRITLEDVFCLLLIDRVFFKSGYSKSNLSMQISFFSAWAMKYHLHSYH